MKYTCLLLMACSILCGQLRAAEKPNIIVILVDDMEFSDIGCYGSEIPTPNLDMLAKGGQGPDRAKELGVRATRSSPEDSGYVARLGNSRQGQAGSKRIKKKR